MSPLRDVRWVVLCLAVSSRSVLASGDVSTELTLGSSHGASPSVPPQAETLPLAPSLWLPSRAGITSTTIQDLRHHGSQRSSPLPDANLRLGTGLPSMSPHMKDILSRPWLPNHLHAPLGETTRPWLSMNTGGPAADSIESGMQGRQQHKSNLRFRRPKPVLPSIDTSRPPFQVKQSEVTPQSAATHPAAAYGPWTNVPLSAHRMIPVTHSAFASASSTTPAYYNIEAPTPPSVTSRTENKKAKISEEAPLTKMLYEIFGEANDKEKSPDKTAEKAPIVVLSDEDSLSVHGASLHAAQGQQANEILSQGSPAATKSNAAPDNIVFEKMKESIKKTLQERMSNSKSVYKKGQLARWANNHLTRVNKMQRASKLRDRHKEAEAKALAMAELEKPSSMKFPLQILSRAAEQSSQRQQPKPTASARLSPDVIRGLQGAALANALQNKENGNAGTREELLRNWAPQRFGLTDTSSGERKRKNPMDGIDGRDAGANNDNLKDLEVAPIGDPRGKAVAARHKRRLKTKRPSDEQMEVLSKFRQLKYYRRCLAEGRPPPPEMDFEYGFPGAPPKSWLRWQCPLNKAEFFALQRAASKRHEKSHMRLASALTKFYQEQMTGNGPAQENGYGSHAESTRHSPSHTPESRHSNA